jgi:hypothetical protein
VLRRIFGPTRGDVIGENGILNIEELIDLYSSPTIVLMIKSRTMRWAGHVARTGESKGYTGFWHRSLRERDHLENLSVDGIIILR